MATTTPNFGWSVPTSSDLVKNGATAIETLGDSIDASLVDLKGGTTGQVLAKASNTDMDFVWAAQDDSNAIQNALLTTTGDTIYASAASTPARLGIGSAGQVLTVSSGIPAWASPAGSNTNWVAVNAGGTSLSGSSTTISGITGANQLMVLFYNGSSTNTYVEFYARINNDTGSNYLMAGVNQAGSTTGNFSTDTGNKIIVAGGSSNAAAAGFGSLVISGGNASGVKSFSGVGATDAGGGSGQGSYIYGGYWNNSATITSINFFPSAGTFDTGTVYVFKSA
jgi:hypothetical protein